MNNYTTQDLKAYFGDYKDQANDMLNYYEWDVIVNYMDDEICEELHYAIAPCDDYTFLMWYFAKHTEKFGEDFWFN